MSVETVFMKAANLHRICEITRADGSSMLIEPYASFTSVRNRQEYLCFQVSEPQGWREIEARSVTGLKMQEARFTTRTDYSPLDRERYPVMHFSIPTHDGRLRWGEKGSTRQSMSLVRPHTE